MVPVVTKKTLGSVLLGIYYVCSLVLFMHGGCDFSTSCVHAYVIIEISLACILFVVYINLSKLNDIGTVDHVPNNTVLPRYITSVHNECCLSTVSIVNSHDDYSYPIVVLNPCDCAFHTATHIQ